MADKQRNLTGIEQNEERKSGRRTKQSRWNGRERCGKYSWSEHRNHT